VEYKNNNKVTFVINIIGNILVFIPFGFLFPITFHKQLNRLDKLLFTSVIGIVFVEIMQLVLKLGVSDVDDLILNSIGIVIGFVILKTIEK
jgi:glycopeptide antibiotics resistance protein